MLAAQTLAGEDTLLTTLLGFGALALFVGALLALHVRRWRRHGFAPRLRRWLHSTRARAGPPAGTFFVSGDAASAAPHGATEPRLHGPGPPPSAGANGMTAAPPSGQSSPAAASLAEDAAGSSASREPVGADGARHRSETLEPLARSVEMSRRIAAADARLAEALAALPRDRWQVEHYALISGRWIPFLVLGEGGVFTIWPDVRTPSWGDQEFANGVAKVIKDLLPGYAHPVRVGFCRAFDHGMPRWWSQGKGGAWVMGLDGLMPWLQHFGPEPGLGVEDLARFNALAGPHWRRPVRRGARLPSTPNWG